MKKRLYRWRFFLAVVVVILAGAGIWIFQKKSRTFVPATEVSLKGPYGTLTLQLSEVKGESEGSSSFRSL